MGPVGMGLQETSQRAKGAPGAQALGPEGTASGVWETADKAITYTVCSYQSALCLVLFLFFSR